MSTLNDWVFEVRQHVQTFPSREERHVLLNSMDSSQTSLTIPSTDKLGALVNGALIEVDSEIMYVDASDAGSNSVTVIRGQENTAGAAHLAGATITVGPKFPKFAVVRALAYAINDLSGPLFAVASASLTWTSGVIGYDLGDSAAREILDIDYQEQNTSQKRTVKIYDWVLDTSADTAVFPSGVSVQINQGLSQSGQTFRVTYKKDLVPLVNLTDNVNLTGLPDTAYDLPPLNAALQLMAGRPVRRSFTEAQPDPRRSQEVGTGSIESSTRLLAQRYDRRLQAEHYALLGVYPPKIMRYGTRLRPLTRRGAAW
jgi:hypothetical protein